MSDLLSSPFVVANWKMSMSLSGAYSFFDRLARCDFGTAACNVIVCPSFVHLQLIVESARSCAASIGAQNCAHEDGGAYTSQVSARMLKEIGCSYVLLGHCESREYLHEDDALIFKKTKVAVDHGILPIVCVGESLSEYQNGKTREVLYRQLESLIPLIQKNQIIVAYEPVWSIGSGIAAEIQDIAFALQTIQSIASYSGVKILYGGSVNQKNVCSIMKGCKGLSGVLVGGASLDVEHFLNIKKQVEQ